jgi:cell division protein FtsX
MFYYSFMWLGLAGMLFILLMPEKYDMSFRLMVVCAAPLAGHFIALTNTKATNITFLVLTAVTLAVTLLNIGLWTS